MNFKQSLSHYSQSLYLKGTKRLTSFCWMEKSITFAPHSYHRPDGGIGRRVGLKNQ